MQRKAYALVGASAAIAAAVGPLLGGFITTYLSWRVGFGLELVIIAIVLVNIRLVKEVPYTGPRQIDPVGAVLSAVGMGGIVLGILVWQEGGSAVGALLAVGATGLGSLVWWLRRRKRQGKAVLLDPGLFKLKGFRLGITGQMLQQIALGGLMIVLPIYLQMVFEYTAMGAGLTIAPLSLGMFATALVASKRAGRRRPASLHSRRLRAARDRRRGADPDRPPGAQRLAACPAAARRRGRARTPRLPAEQLHPLADRGGARQRGGRRQLGGGFVRAVVRSRVRGRDHADDAVLVVRRPGAGRATCSPSGSRTRSLTSSSTMRR